MIQEYSNLQEKFFDKSKHRFPAEKILNPSLSLQLEILHIKKLLNLKPKSTLLDFGCGSGRLTVPFLSMGFDVSGVDISANSLNELESIYKSHRQKKWGKLSIAQTLPKKAVFDGIIGSDILHHVDCRKYFPLLRKLLKKGSPVVFSEPNAWYPFWYPYILLHWKVEKGFFHCSIPNLSKDIKDAGFQKSEFSGHGLLPTRFLNPFPFLCRQNALYWGVGSLTKYLAFRLLIKATS